MIILRCVLIQLGGTRIFVGILFSGYIDFFLILEKLYIKAKLTIECKKGRKRRKTPVFNGTYSGLGLISKKKTLYSF